MSTEKKYRENPKSNRKRNEGEFLKPHHCFYLGDKTRPFKTLKVSIHTCHLECFRERMGDRIGLVACMSDPPPPFCPSECSKEELWNVSLDVRIIIFPLTFCSCCLVFYSFPRTSEGQGRVLKTTFGIWIILLGSLCMLDSAFRRNHCPFLLDSRCLMWIMEEGQIPPFV